LSSVGVCGARVHRLQAAVVRFLREDRDHGQSAVQGRIEKVQVRSSQFDVDVLFAATEE